MDHYKALGLSDNASKEEIKKAFRKLAMEFHPDKHSHSSKQSRESFTHKFKQISEAYETLIDDQKRADYNHTRTAYNRNQPRSRYSGGGAYSYGNSYRYGYGYSGSARRSGGGGGNGSVGGIFTRFEMGIRFLTTKTFLLNATLACVVLGATVLIDASGHALWRMQNPGKSFEEAMDSLEKRGDNKPS